jgi:hypothetical protein
LMIAVTGVVALLGVGNIILIWAMCSPPEALWDKSIKGAKCLDSHIQQYLTLVLQGLAPPRSLTFVSSNRINTFIWQHFLPSLTSFMSSFPSSSSISSIWRSARR